MEITIVLDDRLIEEAEAEAKRRGTTVSKIVGDALRQYLGSTRTGNRLPPLPAFRSGGELVDIADRDALYDAMDDASLYRTDG
jgi:hypothetical protein